LEGISKLLNTIKIIKSKLTNQIFQQEMLHTYEQIPVTGCVGAGDTQGHPKTHTGDGTKYLQPPGGGGIDADALCTIENGQG